MFKLIFTLLMMATILSAQTGDLPTDGLVGHWTFNNASSSVILLTNMRLLHLRKPGIFSKGQ